MHYHQLFLERLARTHRSAVTVGELVDEDSREVALAIYAHMLGHHFARRLLRDPRAGDRARAAVDDLLARAAVPGPSRS